MRKILKINAASIAVLQVIAMAPGAFAELSDLQKAADAATIAAQAPTEKAWSLSGAAFEDNSPAPASGAMQTEQKSGLKSPEKILGNRPRALRSYSIAKPSKKISEGGAPEGRWGLFKMGFNAGFTAFMIPPAAVAQIPYVGKIGSYLVGIPCLVLGAVAGVFMGAYRAFLGQGS